MPDSPLNIIDEYISGNSDLDQKLVNRLILGKLMDTGNIVEDIKDRIEEQNGAILELKEYQVSHPSIIWLVRYRTKRTLTIILSLATAWMILWSSGVKTYMLKALRLE